MWIAHLFEYRDDPIRVIPRHAAVDHVKFTDVGIYRRLERPGTSPLQDVAHWRVSERNRRVTTHPE